MCRQRECWQPGATWMLSKLAFNLCFTEWNADQNSEASGLSRALLQGAMRQDNAACFVMSSLNTC